MALTYSADRQEVVGSQRVIRGTITFDASYPTGGESFTPASVGLTQLNRLNVFPSGPYVPAWNRSTSAPLVLVYMGDNNNASDGPLIQVADTTDLSAVVVPFEAVGY